MESSKGKLLGYWVLTAMLGLSASGSAVMDFMGHESVVEGMKSLGYPLYVLMILGVFKLAGAIVVLAPGLKRLKEWAYAGFMIDFVGATASHVLNGDAIDKIMPPVILLTIAMGSYFLRPNSRKLLGD